jgi:hypothetical protein
MTKVVRAVHHQLSVGFRQSETFVTALVFYTLQYGSIWMLQNRKLKFN